KNIKTCLEPGNLNVCRRERSGYTAKCNFPHHHPECMWIVLRRGPPPPPPPPVSRGGRAAVFACVLPIGGGGW
ncbi:unnamed protein product, partial [Lampetra fluviatilis]